MKQKSTNLIVLDGESLNLVLAEEIASGVGVALSGDLEPRIVKSRDYVKSLVHSKKPIYGINTGFGFLSEIKIGSHKMEELQYNLIRSHASGYGDPLPIPETRLAMALRLNVLIKGFTGVRYELCEALLNLINAHIYPLIPEYGSVGASGDLAPLAHLALPLIGEGWVHFDGKKMKAAEALQKSGLKPIRLMEKEGLGLINGTQVMLSVGSIALAAALKVCCKADKIAALSFEGLGGHIDALDTSIHALRNQTGQIRSASAIRKELEGSYLYNSELSRSRVQDSYSLRCAPQIHGASHDALAYAVDIVERELNAVTDNPLVFAKEGKILSGGNFHGQPLAMAFDIAAIAVAELGNVSERRLELLLNPHLSGLPSFLTPNQGLNSGFMAAQYLSASLVNENKILANPACTDSIPGNVGIEDHVSMGMTSARKFKRIVSHTAVILAIEMLCAAQAVDLREATPLGAGTKKTYAAVRKRVNQLKNDRILAEDIEKAVKVFETL